MNRTREQWADVCPKTVAQTASPAAVMYLIGDALSDIATLHRQVDQLRAEVEALRKDAERYGLLANMVVADCAGAEMTPQQAALFGSLNAITQIRTTAEFDAVFDAALAGKGGE